MFLRVWWVPLYLLPQGLEALLVFLLLQRVENLYALDVFRPEEPRALGLLIHDGKDPPLGPNLVYRDSGCGG
ncbi:hypothetical protein F5Y17DRAFT_427826, partial [Xylariaceae sp. FL0594]